MSLDPTRVYFWKATWSNEFRLIVEEGRGGRRIYELAMSSQGSTVCAQPALWRFVGASNGAVRREKPASWPGATYRNFWIERRSAARDTRQRGQLIHRLFPMHDVEPVPALSARHCRPSASPASSPAAAKDSPAAPAPTTRAWPAPTAKSPIGGAQTQTLRPALEVN